MEAGGAESMSLEGAEVMSVWCACHPGLASLSPWEALLVTVSCCVVAFVNI